MNWMHRKITDYWDSATREPESAADRLDQLDESGRARALTEIADAVTEHLRVLPDDVMLQAAVPIIDDLYKGACYAGRWDASLEAYLEASASTFFSGVADRGLTVQYAVDNAWEDLTRPLQLFPSWFTACGFVYVCPQEVVRIVVELRDGDPVNELSQTALAATSGAAVGTVMCVGSCWR